MKTCPYCAENIKEEAKVCKHCEKHLDTKDARMRHNLKLTEEAKKELEKRISKMSEKEKEAYYKEKARSKYAMWLWIIAVILMLYFYAKEQPITAVAILIVSILIHPSKEGTLMKELLKFMRKIFKRKNSKKYVIIGICSIAVIGGLTYGGYYLSEQIEMARKAEEEKIIAEYPSPEITIISSTEHQGDSKEYILEFTTSDSEEVRINGELIQPTADDKYVKTITLKEISTSLTIDVENKYKSNSEALEIIRNMTSEESRLEREQKQEKERLEKERKHKAELERMREYPKLYVDIVKNNWYMGGFGSIPIHAITLKNTGEVDYENIDLSFSYYSSNDILLDIKAHTIWDTLPAGQTKTFREINTGFTDSQVSKSKVKIEWVSIMN